MAIEIRELKIKGYIDKNRKTSNSPELTNQQIEKLKKSIINECVSKVMDKIDRQSRR